MKNQILYLLQGTVLETQTIMNPASAHHSIPEFIDQLYPQMFAGSFMEDPHGNGELVGAIFFTTGEQRMTSICLLEQVVEFEVLTDEDKKVKYLLTKTDEKGYWCGHMQKETGVQIPVACFIQEMHPKKLYDMKYVSKVLDLISERQEN